METRLEIHTRPDSGICSSETDKPIAGEGSVGMEPVREDGLKVDLSEAEESQSPIQSLEEALEDEETIVMRIPNSTYEARESGALTDAVN